MLGVQQTATSTSETVEPSSVEMLSSATTSHLQVHSQASRSATRVRPGLSTAHLSLASPSKARWKSRIKGWCISSRYWALTHQEKLTLAVVRSDLTTLSI